MEQASRQRSRFYSFGPFCLDASRLLLLKDGEPLSLAPRFFRVLSLLVQNHGRDLDKEYLIDRVWPDTAVQENNLTIIISGLRKILGDDLGRHRYIVTIPGHGYRFVAEVDEQPTAPLSATFAQSNSRGLTTTQLGDSVLPRGWKAVSQKRHLWLSLATLCTLSLILGIWAAKTRTTAKADALRTMAVLPFESIGFGSEDEYLGFGMADALSARLRNYEQILVRSATEALASQPSGYDAISVGRMLNVNVLLAGSVNKIGDRIDVNVRLLHAADGSVLWSERFSGQTKQILTIQERVAEGVASALTQNRNAFQRRDAVQHYTRDLEAYEMYLHGQYFLNHRSRYSAEEDFERAIEYFQHAIDRDQHFAVAYASLATAYNRMSQYLTAEDSWAKAEAAAQTALTIDRDLPEAYRALAVAKQEYDWNFDAADAAYRHSLELDPEDTVTHRWYADELVAMGRVQDAENEWRKAQQLDPYSSLYDTLGHLYFYSRRYREAFAQFEGKQDVDPDAFWYLAWMYQFHRGELATTADGFRPSLLAFGPRRRSACDAAYAESPALNDNVVQLCLRSVQKGASTPYVSPYKIALLYVALDDRNKAFYWLDRARRAHSWDLIYIKVDPRIDALRADARFDALLGRMNLTH